jgi:hypothetical protein
MAGAERRHVLAGQAAGVDHVRAAGDRVIRFGGGADGRDKDGGAGPGAAAGCRAPRSVPCHPQSMARFFLCR